LINVAGIDYSTYDKSVVPGFLSPLEKKSFNKKFLNFNSTWRTHRIALTAMLYNRKLLDHGYVSFSPRAHRSIDAARSSWNEYLDHVRLVFNDQEIAMELKQAESFGNLLPLVIDSDNFSHNTAYGSDRPLVKYYKNTYFSLVNETHYHNNCPRFLTEKIYKPIAQKQPFVLTSTPHSLAALRQLGYKTFGDIIDESYDKETNDNKRLKLIANEVERLCNLSASELDDFCSKGLEIVNHNFKTLITKHNFIHKLI
jgi:hypothetical protein